LGNKSHIINFAEKDLMVKKGSSEVRCAEREALAEVQNS
jgi:hypothetical protein